MNVYESTSIIDALAKSKENLQTLSGNNKQVNEKDKRVVRLELEDHIILDANEDGKDLLFMAIPIRYNDKDYQFRFQFPTYGKYDQFAASFADLINIMTLTAENLLLPEDFNELIELQNRGDFGSWAILTSVSLKPRSTYTRVENIFFKYLNPEVAGLDLAEIIEETKLIYIRKIQKKEKISKIKATQKADKIPDKIRKIALKRFMRNNLPIDSVLKMFIAILNVDDFLKKKWKYLLQQTFQKVISVQPLVSSEKNSESNTLNSVESQLSKHVAF